MSGKMNEEVQRFNAEQEEGREQGFRLFMNDPAVKALFSMIPPGPEDALTSLVKAAYERGHNNGCTQAIVFMVQKIMKG